MKTKKEREHIDIYIYIFFFLELSGHRHTLSLSLSLMHMLWHIQTRLRLLHSYTDCELHSEPTELQSKDERYVSYVLVK